MKKINLKTNNNKIYYKITVSILKNNRYQVIDNIGIYNVKYNYVLFNKLKLKYYLSIGAILTPNILKKLNKLNK